MLALIAAAWLLWLTATRLVGIVIELQGQTSLVAVFRQRPLYEAIECPVVRGCPHQSNDVGEVLTELRMADILRQPLMEPVLPATGWRPGGHSP